ncbi:MAG: tyrosine-type recombinase/integrase [Bacteroidia bacterium]|nr:tyrosine-type recombinase/integrase [Bacteroidia bacterium]GIV23613.1 MAG: tyrosine recombinase XerC [Bacteroidia bacterium]
MLEDFLSYLAGAQKASPHTIAAYRRDLLQWSRFCQVYHGFDPLVSPTEWRRASPLHIRAWLSFFPRPSTRARKVAALRRMDRYIRRILREKGLSSLPTSPRLPKSLPRALPESHLLPLLPSGNSENDFITLRDALGIELLYGSGLRRSEACALQLSQVHLPARELHILGKGNKWRVLPLYPYLHGLLEKYLALRAELNPSHAYLLCTEKGAPLYPKALYRIIRSQLGTHPHALRHSFATHLLRHGANVQAVRDLLGHSSLASTQKYLAVTPPELRAAYQKFHPRA